MLPNTRPKDAIETPKQFNTGKRKSSKALPAINHQETKEKDINFSNLGSRKVLIEEETSIPPPVNFDRW